MDLKLSLPTSAAVLQPSPKIVGPARLLLTPIPDTPGEFLLVLDNTSLEYFTTCPTSARYKLVERREAHAKNAALTFGGAIHEGLESYLNWQALRSLSEEKTDMDYRIEAKAEVAYGPSTQDSAIHNYFLNNPTPLDEYRTLTNALAVMMEYRMRAAMPDYEWIIQSDDHGPIIERAFELPLGVLEVDATIDMSWLTAEQLINCDAQQCAATSEITARVYVSRIYVAWSGRIDAVAFCNNAMRVVDHKTTSIAGDQFIQDFRISNQVLGYVWAAQQLWPDIAPSGFCLNAIHFKKPTGNGPINAPGPRGGPSALNFFRAYFDYSPERLAEWADNTLAIVSDFVHCLVRDYYPRHTKWCFGKYGRCSYHDVCVQDDERVRMNMLRSDMFKDVTWDPVKGR